MGGVGAGASTALAVMAPGPSKAERLSYRSPDVLYPYTVGEIAMLRLSYLIRQKADWQQKRHDPVIARKWRQELEEQCELEARAWVTKVKASLGLQLNDSDWRLRVPTKEQLDYVFDQLALHEARSRVSSLELSVFHCIYESRSLVSLDLRSRLLDQVKLLEISPHKDWHPGSNEQVLDLVHPSLFCVKYGTTMGKDALGDSVVIEPPKEIFGVKTADDYDYEGDPDKASGFQWLPTDFDISRSADGAISAKALSYINNVHPQEQRALYPVLEELVACFVPMWERVLGDAHTVRLHTEGYGTEANGGHRGRLIPWDDRMQWTPWDWGNDFSDSEWDDPDIDMKRPITVPQPDPFEMPDQLYHPEHALTGKMQIIVKLANIHLTPEKPTYEGGSWHIEGVPDEHIAATGLYYYDVENITTSELGFRGSFSDLFEYEQNDDRGVKLVLDVESETDSIQDFGAATVTEGKCIAFPNVYQHRVSPFSLADKSKPGHRKIVAFFLIDPCESIPSTSTVPPQQRTWWEREVAMGRFDSIKPALPPELWSSIFDHTGCIKPLDEAKKDREALMEERKAGFFESGDRAFYRSFSLCEH